MNLHETLDTYNSKLCLNTVAVIDNLCCQTICHQSKFSKEKISEKKKGKKNHAYDQQTSIQINYYLFKYNKKINK